jgi:hypothetical protein
MIQGYLEIREIFHSSQQFIIVHIHQENFTKENIILMKVFRNKLHFLL